MTKRTFEVTGRDARGELQIFCTDDRDQAEAMRRHMARSLRDVQLIEGG